MRTSIHSGGTGIIRHSPRNGFNGVLRALPGDEFLFATVTSQIEWLRGPGWVAKTSARLSISNGCQDHTLRRTLQRRSSCAPLLIAHEFDPAPRPHAHTTLPRPPHPALHVRDDRDTPLVDEAGWAN
jgi:hypothetical protein